MVSSGYSYAGYIRKFKKIDDYSPRKVLRMSVIEYLEDLENMINYFKETFKETFEADQLEEFDEDKKTSWGQVYDV